MDKTTLYNYFKGNATDAQRRTVRKWVEASPENKAEFMRERRLFDATLLLTPLSGKKSFGARIRRIARVAVAAAAVFAAGIVFRYAMELSEESLVQQVVVPMGQRVNLQLADGTDVWLNSGSRFSYSTGFSKKEREVSLDGEGYFKVTKDSRHPFVVHTSKADVEVLGTEFNVKAYNHSPEFTTSLIEGSVRLVSDRAKTVLKPSEEAVLRDGTFVISKIADEDEFLWREGILCFGETSFIDLMKLFEQFYGVKIRVDNRDVVGYSSIGKFRQSDGVEHALRVLASDAGFTYEIDNDNQLIIIK